MVEPRCSICTNKKLDHDIALRCCFKGDRWNPKFKWLDTTYVAGAEEWHLRIQALIKQRGMTVRSARIVIDAAMYGIGCTEGRVREQIEAQKNKPTS